MKRDWFWVSAAELASRGICGVRSGGMPPLEIRFPVLPKLGDFGPFNSEPEVVTVRHRTFRLEKDPEAFTTESLCRPLDADQPPKRWWFYREHVGPSTAPETP